MNNAELEIVYKNKITSVADVIEVTNDPLHFMSKIVDNDPTSPIGHNHQGIPRPYPHGIWYRGQSNSEYIAIPSAFRTDFSKKKWTYYDEREMFTDVRLRASKIDLRGLNNLELMFIMQHHDLPTRLLDWSESPLIALFFAVSKYLDRSVERTDCAFYVLNAYNLNALTNISLNPDSRIFHQQDIDTILRSAMAEHIYINNVFSKIDGSNVARDANYKNILKRMDSIIEVLNSSGSTEKFIDRLDTDDDKFFYNRMCAPVAVMPRRDHPRMKAQLSCFTVHGGKVIFRQGTSEEAKEVFDDWNFIPDPIHLHQINGINQQLGIISAKFFMMKFVIDKNCVDRIIDELDRLGVSEAIIYQDMENQSKFAKRRWSISSNGDRFLKYYRNKVDFRSRLV